MKLYQLMVSEHINAIFLYLLIMLAGIDYTGLIDYVLKAALGSAIWFGFRVLGDYYSARIKRSINHSKEERNGTK